MYQTGLLLLIGPIRLVVEGIAQYLKRANETVIKRLYVKLEPEACKHASKADTDYLFHLASSMPLVYNKATNLCKDLDVRFLLTSPNNLKASFGKVKLDVVLTNSSDERYVSGYVDQYFNQNSCKIIKLVENVSAISAKNNFAYEFSIYKIVCLGGTFDRLHNGHKVLLSEAALRATKKLIVGVTDGQMLKKKVLWELIEPVQKRIADVETFLYDIDPSLHYEVVPITDPYGPTLSDPDIDCIVVSAETKKGGEKVNSERKARGMKELQMHIVELVENSHRNPSEEEKLSSSTIRIHLLGTPILKPEKIQKLDIPYCVFLQGQPASGKSCISNLFQTMGMLTVCCNEIIISSIKEDNDLRNKICQIFDENFVYPDDSFNYKRLMVMYFKYKEKQQAVAAVLADKVKAEVHKKLEIFEKQGVKVILLKDSTLLAGNMEIFDGMIHEVWTSVLPVSEISRRLQHHYNLTEDEATYSALSVPPNEQLIQKSNIVFSTQWDLDNTQKQVQRAWSYLQCILGEPSKI